LVRRSPTQRCMDFSSASGHQQRVRGSGYSSRTSDVSMHEGQLLWIAQWCKLSGAKFGADLGF